MTSSQNSTCGPNAFYWTEAWPVTLQTDLVWRWWLPSAVLPPGPTKSRRPSSETQLSLLQRPNTCCCIWVPSESSQLLGNLKIILYWQRLGFSSSELEETLKRKKNKKTMPSKCALWLGGNITLDKVQWTFISFQSWRYATISVCLWNAYNEKQFKSDDVN